MEIFERFGWVVVKEKHTIVRKKHPGKAPDKGEDKLQTVNGKLMRVGKMETGT